MNNLIKKLGSRRGLSILIVVIAVSALTLIIAATAAFISLGMLRSGMRHAESLKTFAAADSCIEEALMRLHTIDRYESDTFTIGDFVCTVSVETVGARSTILASAKSADYFVRQVKAVVDKSDKYYIVEWKEID